jgi:DnaJ like chaperone protein
MNQNHPDKLVAKGLPESMMKAAEEKTRSIRAAYEVICESRGIK